MPPLILGNWLVDGVLQAYQYVVEWAKTTIGEFLGVDWNTMNVADQITFIWNFVWIADRVIPFSECLGYLGGGFIACLSVRAVRYLIGFIPGVSA